MEKKEFYEFGNKDTKFTIFEDGSVKAEGAKIKIEVPSQLDRIEKKMDRVLELMGVKETSTFNDFEGVPFETIIYLLSKLDSKIINS